MDTAVRPTGAALPPEIEKLLESLVASAQSCFGDDLQSVILFGSGAEGHLRSTSDLNLLFVLRRFEKDRVDSFREPLRAAYMAARAAAMFLLDSETEAAAEAFAVKFEDMQRRRRVLFGEDVIARLNPSREARKVRLRQVLMNLFLRLRERYTAIGLREEQLVAVIADAAGPLRSSAASLLQLEGTAVRSPKEALARVAEKIAGTRWSPTLERVSQARETKALPPGTPGPVVFELIALAEAMYRRSERLD